MSTKKNIIEPTVIHHSSIPDVHQFNHAQYWGYGLILIVYTVGEYAQRWESLEYFRNPTQEHNKVIFVLRSILFIELVMLIFRWFIATMNELEMWSKSGLDWTHWDNDPFSKQNAYVAILGLAVFLGLLLVFVNKIIVIASVFSLYHLFLYWTQWLCNSHFERALKDTKVNDNTLKKRFAIMEHYWLKQPQLPRMVTMLFLSMVSVIFATVALFQSEQKPIFEESAYGILIMIILIGEIIIAIWRFKRDRELAKLLD